MSSLRHNFNAWLEFHCNGLVVFCGSSIRSSGVFLDVTASTHLSAVSRVSAVLCLNLCLALEWTSGFALANGHQTRVVRVDELPVPFG